MTTEPLTLPELQTLMSLLIGFGDLISEDPGPLIKKIDGMIKQK